MKLTRPPNKLNILFECRFPNGTGLLQIEILRRAVRLAYDWLSYFQLALMRQMNSLLFFGSVQTVHSLVRAAIWPWPPHWCHAGRGVFAHLWRTEGFHSAGDGRSLSRHCLSWSTEPSSSKYAKSWSARFRAVIFSITIHPWYDGAVTPIYVMVFLLSLLE